MMYAIDNEEDFAEIFAEEAECVFKTMDERLADWRELPGDRAALTELRRAFHTLKGSGRMVNALDLAEVAWKVENMLNRVIDGSVEVTNPLIELVSKARDLLPGMLESFKNGSAGTNPEAEGLMAQADALATGRKSIPAPPQNAVPAAPDAGQSMAVEVVKLNRKLETVRKRSDESLHRSEMALQHARRFGTHVSTLKGEIRDLAHRLESNPAIEQVERLTKNVQDIQLRTLQAAREPQPHRRELNKLIDQLVRERLAPMQHRRGELERQLDEVQRAASASRKLAWLGLTMSTLLGAAAIAALATSGLLG